jgi:5,10-methylenetetrahydrofolate reductase
VFELDAVGLARTVSHLNAGRSVAGRDLDDSTDFTIAVAANPGANDLNLERDRFAEKVAAGAHFAQTQPVFDARTVEAFLNTVKPEIPVLYGVLPVRSLEMAERVSRWTHVPEALIDDLRVRGRKAGIEWASRVVHELREMGVNGVHLYPLGHPKVVTQVLGALTDPISRLV